MSFRDPQILSCRFMSFLELSLFFAVSFLHLLFRKLSHAFLLFHALASIFCSVACIFIAFLFAFLPPHNIHSIAMAWHSLAQPLLLAAIRSQISETTPHSHGVRSCLSVANRPLSSCCDRLMVEIKFTLRYGRDRTPKVDQSSLYLLIQYSCCFRMYFFFARLHIYFQVCIL